MTHDYPLDSQERLWQGLIMNVTDYIEENGIKVYVSDLGMVYFEAHDRARLDEVKAAVVKVTTEYVLNVGKTAKISYHICGRFGGAVITGYGAKVSFQ